MAKFAKGKSGNPNGRPEGSENKTTKAVKQAILEAMNSGAGAVAFFNKLKNGSADDRRCFANICARMIPHEITGADGAPLFNEPLSDMELIETARRAAFLLWEAGEKLKKENH